jgi:protein phosphatase 2C family protein 2/3
MWTCELVCRVFLPVDPAYADETSGCTAVAALITQDWRVIVANAGDSRIVLSGNGEAVPLSFDHKPTNERMHFSYIISI